MIQEKSFGQLPYGLCALGLLLVAWTSPAHGTKGQVSVAVRVAPGPAGEDLKALTVSLTYPKQLVTLPGTGADQGVRDRVQLVPADEAKDDLLVVNNQREVGVLRAVYVRQPPADAPPISAGDFLRVTFDVPANVPTATEFSCAVGGASDRTGRTLDGVTCSVALGKP